jgi:hypothetical protein
MSAVAWSDTKKKLAAIREAQGITRSEEEHQAGADKLIAQVRAHRLAESDSPQNASIGT